MSKLLFLIAEDSYFCSHRLNLAKAAMEAGFEVVLATRVSKHLKHIESLGIKVFPLERLRRSSLNPFQQLLALFELYRVYKEFQPDIVHQVAMKPVVLGSIVARICRVPKVINALGGLGFVFTEGRSEDRSFYHILKKSVLRKGVLKLFSWIFSKTRAGISPVLILQNPDDRALLVGTGCIEEKNIVLIRGAGIDTEAFPVLPMPSEPPVIIACVSRMLWDKGIGELVKAAGILRGLKVPAKVRLYGAPDPENPASIPREVLEGWHRDGIIEWMGHCDEVAKVYAESHIAVLPSYREGLPKSLLEAASCGRPIVTTDVPGCREVVVHGENGLLVPVKNGEALAEALMRLCQDNALRAEMGKAGRERVEAYFSESIVNRETIKLYTASYQ